MSSQKGKAVDQDFSEDPQWAAEKAHWDKRLLDLLPHGWPDMWKKYYGDTPLPSLKKEDYTCEEIIRKLWLYTIEGNVRPEEAYFTSKEELASSQLVKNLTWELAELKLLKHYRCFFNTCSATFDTWGAILPHVKNEHNFDALSETVRAANREASHTPAGPQALASSSSTLIHDIPKDLPPRNKMAKETASYTPPTPERPNYPNLGKSILSTPRRAVNTQSTPTKAGPSNPKTANTQTIDAKPAITQPSQSNPHKRKYAAKTSNNSDNDNDCYIDEEAIAKAITTPTPKPAFYCPFTQDSESSLEDDVPIRPVSKRMKCSYDE